jgi:hypothetical protein
MQHHAILESPILLNQESLQLQAFDPKVLAYVWNPGAMGRLIFLGDHHAVFYLSLRDDKRIGEIAALKKFLLIEILLKVRDSVNLRNKGQLFHCRILEEVPIVSFQQANNGFVESALKLQPCLPYRNYLFVFEGNVKLLPEGREPIAVIMIEDVG